MLRAVTLAAAVAAASGAFADQRGADLRELHRQQPAEAVPPARRVGQQGFEVRRVVGTAVQLHEVGVAVASRQLHDAEGIAPKP